MQSKPNAANAKNSLFLCQNFPNILKELYDPKKYRIQYLDQKQNKTSIRI